MASGLTFYHDERKRGREKKTRQDWFTYMNNNDLSTAYHSALEKLFVRVKSNGHQLKDMGNVTLYKRFNGQTGVHVHASASVKIRFDESCELTGLMK